MRLLETVRVPSAPVKPPTWFPWAPGGIYYGLVVFDSVGPFMYFSNTIVEKSSIRFFFTQPKLGRRWTVERLVMNVVEIFTNTSEILGAQPWPNQLSISTQMFLNDVPVSAANSLIYDHDPNFTPISVNPINGADVTQQNGPLLVEPYSPIQVNSGDILSAEVSFGIARPQTGTRNFQSVMKFGLQLMGENEAATIQRQ